MGIFIRKHVPMLRYALFAMAGIAFSQYFHIQTYVLLLLMSIAAIYLLYQVYRPGNNYRTHLFISISLIVFFAGMLRHTLWKNTEATPVSDRQLRIISIPSYSTFAIRFEAEELSSHPFDFTDRVKYIVSCQDTTTHLYYGDIISTSVQPQALESAPLPYQFDYTSYLFSRGITSALNICHAHLIPDHSNKAWFYRWIEHSRTTFKKQTTVVFGNTSSKGLAESLLLGYREDLSTETKDAFQKSGVSHLLAVSGMHTALIYEMLFLLFLPFGTSQKHRIVFLLTALCVLFYFTILSGCSASVLRSSIMCASFAVGYAFRKKGSGLNTLGTSMLIILYVSPYQLWDLGFQLSVLAVFGILTLHSAVSSLFEHTHKVYKYILNAVSITVCAQVMTLPVILYHFHSFPLYFIPANIVLIPVSTVGMFMTMFSITIAGLDLSIPYLFECTQWVIQLFEQCAAMFASLPHSLIQPISFTAYEYILCMIVIICYMVLYSYSKAYRIVMLSLGFLWICIRIYTEHTLQQRSTTLFICNSKKSGLLHLNGLQADFYIQKPYSPKELKNIQDYFNLPILTSQILPADCMGMHWELNNKRCAWLYKKPSNMHPSDVLSSQDSDFLFAYQKPDTSILRHKKIVLLNSKTMLYLK